MSAATVLARGRVRAQQLMTDACTIKHPTGLSTNATTGVVTPTYAAPLYTGACKIDGGETPSGSDIAEAHLAVLSLTVHVPITVTGVVEGDVVTITAASDSELVGRTFRVNGPMHKSYATARRLACTETTS